MNQIEREGERQAERERERKRERGRERERERERKRGLWHIESQAWYTPHPREKPCLSYRRQIEKDG